MREINIYLLCCTENSENFIAVDVCREGKVAGRGFGEVENVLHRRRATTAFLFFAVHLSLRLVGQCLETLLALNVFHLLELCRACRRPSDARGAGECRKC